MRNPTKRIVSIILSVLMIVSSLSVGSTVFAAELTTITARSTETITKNDTKIGTATHYDYQYGAAQNWADLLALATDGTEELAHTDASSTIYTAKGDGTYSTESSSTVEKILTKNGLGSDGNSYTCENGSDFAAEFANLYACSNTTTHVEGCELEECVQGSDSKFACSSDYTPSETCEKCHRYNNIVVKQYGWDKDGYYYYDYWNEDGNNTAHTFGDTNPNFTGTMVKLRDESVTAPKAYETTTYTFPRGTVLKDVVFATSTTDHLRASYYEIYATTGKLADLYNAENLIATYDREEDQEIYTSAFASHYTFDQPIEATYVGLKMQNIRKRLLFICEKPFKLIFQINPWRFGGWQK